MRWGIWGAVYSLLEDHRMSEEIIPVAGPPPAAGLSTADASALLARTQELERSLAAERAQRARIEQTTQADKKSAAINSVLANAPLVPGTAAQVARLLADDIALHPDPTTGQLIAVGPGFKPADQYIKEQLGKPEWGHFLRARTPAAAQLSARSARRARRRLRHSRAGDKNSRRQIWAWLS